jgi:glycosyltransferase involved in cell wall biosynthesis
MVPRRGWGSAMDEHSVNGEPVSHPCALFLVEDLPVPLNRRVWQESLTLRRAGFDVAVLCPAGREHDREPFEVREGVEIHRYRLTPSNGGMLGYAREYGAALWRLRRAIKRLARSQKFDVVHACNPPDLLFLAALPLKRTGARFIFDHHDLVPELYLSRFGRGKDLFFRLTLRLERLMFSLADVVISTNESYRAVALGRGRKRPEDVFVVRNGPDLERFRPLEPDSSLKRGRQHLITYLGVMGPQDGIDHALRSLALLREMRQDWHAVFVGDGDVRQAMQRLTHELGLDSMVEFTGMLVGDDVPRILATSDVCLAPDPKTAFNDVSTMNKIVEYMAMSRPIVAYDLVEARASAGNAALYAEPNDERSFALRIAELLGDPKLRTAMGAEGRLRIETALSWTHSEDSLLAAYDRALRPTAIPSAPVEEPVP